MKSFIYIVLLMAMLVPMRNSFAQIKNLKTETVKVNGNCDMCKQTIEKAGNIKNVSTVVWDERTKMATLGYDSEKTGPGDILKQIALAGYDNAQYRAPDDAYAELHECCQYDREITTDHLVDSDEMPNHATLTNHNQAAKSTDQANQLVLLFGDYLSLKNALVKEDKTEAATSARRLADHLQAVDMNALTANEHGVWMKVAKLLTTETEKIAAAKQISEQRKHFIPLSEQMFTLVKASKLEEVIYYQQCPMANDGRGATWLSNEREIKNPYYGSKMLTCGSTIETIK